MDRTPTIRPVTFPQSCAWAALRYGWRRLSRCGLVRGTPSKFPKTTGRLSRTGAGSKLPMNFSHSESGLRAGTRSCKEGYVPVEWQAAQAVTY